MHIPDSIGQHVLKEMVFIHEEAQLIEQYVLKFEVLFVISSLVEFSPALVRKACHLHCSTVFNKSAMQKSNRVVHDVHKVTLLIAF